LPANKRPVIREAIETPTNHEEFRKPLKREERWLAEGPPLDLPAGHYTLGVSGKAWTKDSNATGTLLLIASGIGQGEFKTFQRDLPAYTGASESIRPDVNMVRPLEISKDGGVFDYWLRTTGKIGFKYDFFEMKYFGP